MKTKTLAAALGALFVTAVAAPAAIAATTPIKFDTNGAAAGGVITVSSFDWTQDNALAVGATPLAVAPGTTTFTLYTQGRLGNFLDAGGNAILGTGLNSDFEITFETGITEVGTNIVTPGLGANAVFSQAAAPAVNFFNIYLDAARDSDQLAGTGYGNGNLILSAISLSNSTSFFVPFIDTNGDLINDAPAIVDLDGFGPNDRPGITSVVGQGGGALTAAVTGQDTDYFKSDFSTFVVDLLFNTSNITPFLQANPAALVVGNAPAYGAGGVNGFGGPCTTGATNCDFHFQADGNQSFQAVPEPGNLALFATALGMAGFFGRRRKQG